MPQKIIFLLLFAAVLTTHSFSQDSIYSRRVVDTLSSKYFFGRGYVNEGMAKAAGYIREQFINSGLLPLEGKDFFQYFEYPVNRFPGKVLFKSGRKKLKAGIDYLVSPDSKGIKGRGKLVRIDSARFLDPSNNLLVICQDKLTWSVSQKEANHTTLWMKKGLIASSLKYKCRIDQEFVKNFKAANVCGMVRGKAHPDSFIFITAHYDHLGGMGDEVFFPGANDNASGVALLLNLARYYSAHPQSYSMVFICFAGEEAGLLGSRYFTENPPIALDRIRFLINTDLAGTGEEGITVVNAGIHPKEYEKLVSLNESLHLLKAIRPRGRAANSDHYYFSEKGVPAFFIYTLGGIQAYHDVFDRSSTLPLNEQEDLHSLMRNFVEYLQASN
jgi:hypothetical protein